ncbi:MAG TPA: protein kinase [Gemmataceae bacterium]|nr:protein kinase [Gemmataceae bacterium]
MGTLPAVPGYEIESELGRGGMGVVYKALQIALNRTVALKMILSGEHARPADVVRFLAEAEVVAAIQHPHVVQVFETGQAQGRPYLALEYLPGGSLADRVRSAPLDPREAARVVAELADAVSHAHDRGVIHRDLKPENVLFTAAGIAKVTDFGLAKRVEIGDGLTLPGAVMGTPAYVSPEQARGDTAAINPSSDVYSLGAILYRLVTGRPPFQASTAWETLRQVASADPVPPRRLLPALPRDFDTICLKCLEKDPARRYPSAAALEEDLQRFLDGRPVAARPVGFAERAAKWSRRNPGVAGLLAALAVVFLLGFAGVTWGLLKAEARGRELARANEELAGALTDLTKSHDDLAKAETETKQRATEAETQGYFSDVALAQQLWRSNDLRGMREAMARCPRHLRQWEWHYLDRLSRPTREVIPTGPGVSALAYSPDGRLLGYLLANKEFVLREVAAGRDVLRLSVKDGAYNLGAVVFDPTGQRVAFTTGRSVRLLELPSGRVIASYAIAGKFEDRALGFAPDGSLLAVRVREDREKWTPTLVRVVEVPSEKIRTAIDLPAAEGWGCCGAALAPDASRLAVAFSNSVFQLSRSPEPERPANLRVWEVGSGKLVRRADAGRDMIAAPVFSPDGRSVAFGRAGPFVGELDLDTDELPRVFPGPAPGLRTFGYTPDGFLLAGGLDGVVRARDRLSTAEVFAWRGAPGSIRALAVTPDGNEAAAGTGDPLGPSGGLVRWPGGNPEATIRRGWVGPPRERGAIHAVSPDGRRFAGYYVDTSQPNLSPHRLVLGEVSSPHETVLDPDGTMIATFLPDGTLAYQKLQGNQPVRLVDPGGRPVGELALATERREFWPVAMSASPDGRTLAMVGLNFRRAKSDLPIGHELRVLAWNLADRRLTADRSVTFTEFGHEVGRVPSVGQVGFDRAGRRLAIPMRVPGGKDPDTTPEQCGVLLVWDIQTGAVVLRRDTPFPLYAAGFDHEDRPAVGGGTRYEGRVLVWEPADAREVLSVRGHTGPILALGFGPGGRMVTGGEDRAVKVWDAGRGRELLTLTGHTRRVTSVGFTTDGRAIYSATGHRDTASMDLDLIISEHKIPVEVRLWGDRPDGPNVSAFPRRGNTPQIVPPTLSAIRVR